MKSPPTRRLPRKLLGREPGLLLVCDSPPDLEAELGPVLVAVGGVVVGSAITLDPAADVRVENERELVFGKETLRLREAVPDEFAAELKAWLRFRAEELASYPTVYLSEGPPSDPRFLEPFTVRCPSCGTECMPVVGAIAHRVPTDGIG